MLGEDPADDGEEDVDEDGKPLLNTKMQKLGVLMLAAATLMAVVTLIFQNKGWVAVSGQRGATVATTSTFEWDCGWDICGARAAALLPPPVPLGHWFHFLVCSHEDDKSYQRDADHCGAVEGRLSHALVRGPSPGFALSCWSRALLGDAHFVRRLLWRSVPCRQRSLVPLPSPRKCAVRWVMCVRTHIPHQVVLHPCALRAHRGGRRSLRRGGRHVGWLALVHIGRAERPECLCQQRQRHSPGACVRAWGLDDGHVCVYACARAHAWCAVLVRVCAQRYSSKVDWGFSPYMSLGAAVLCVLAPVAIGCI